MRLNDLKKGDKAKVMNIIASKELKLRLASLGLIKNVSFMIDEISLGKSTVKLSIENNMLALRSEEANAIEIEKINHE